MSSDVMEVGTARVAARRDVLGDLWRQRLDICGKRLPLSLLARFPMIAGFPCRVGASVAESDGPREKTTRTCRSPLVASLPRA